jgi:hypothetical protein
LPEAEADGIRRSTLKSFLSTPIPLTAKNPRGLLEFLLLLLLLLGLSLSLLLEFLILIETFNRRPIWRNPDLTGRGFNFHLGATLRLSTAMNNPQSMLTPLNFA